MVVRVLDALHVALSTHALYGYLIDMFGELAGFLVLSVWYVLVAKIRLPSHLNYDTGASR